MKHMMSFIEQKYRARYLQTAKLHTPCYLAFRCLSLQEKVLSKSNNTLGIVRSAEAINIVIPANSSVIVSGFIEKRLEYHNT